MKKLVKGVNASTQELSEKVNEIVAWINEDESTSELLNWLCRDVDRDDKKIKFQEGTIPEVGKNGLTVEEVLQQCVDRLYEYQRALPCRENSIAITDIETAILWLNKRTEDRIKRGVEGTRKA